MGVVETTSFEQEFTHKDKGLILVDLPGCGTMNWPKETYIDRLKLLSYDCFLLVTTDKFTENDVFPYRELTRCGKPCFVLRNQFDRAVEDGFHDNGLSEKEVRRQIETNIRANLQPAPPERIYFASGRHPPSMIWRGSSMTFRIRSAG